MGLTSPCRFFVRSGTWLRTWVLTFACALDKAAGQRIAPITSISPARNADARRGLLALVFIDADQAHNLLHGIGGLAQREGVAPPDALIAFLRYLGKAPLVAYHALFDQTMIERAMQDFLGVKFGQQWIDLAWVMPELFREHIAEQVGLDDWMAIFGIENILRHNAVSDAYATAKLLQTAIARGVLRGAPSPDSFVDIEKARRWRRAELA